MTLMETQQLLQEINEAMVGEPTKRQLVGFQQRLVDAIISTNATYATQWVANKNLSDRTTDTYATMMAESGTHGFKEGLKRQFEVITNLLNIT